MEDMAFFLSASLGISFVLNFVSVTSAHAESDPVWIEGTRIEAPRSNPLNLPGSAFLESRHQGRLYALHYPVEVSSSLIPWRPVRDFLDGNDPNPIRLLLQRLFERFSKVRSTDDFFDLAGLNPYPDEEGAFPYEIPFVDGRKPEGRMGVTVFRRQDVDVMTISCAACHSAQLFGKTILGMTNRFPRANEFFIQGKKATSLVGPGLFQSVLNATNEEAEVYDRLRRRMHAVEAKTPLILGLDTSLAQVALSLSRRDTDEYATFNRKFEKKPREEKLREFAADSKPAVWWNLKYKNRWLSDGSVVSGNPIYTNLLWNEIGRGTDLRELETWLDRNSRAIQDLTTAVFSAEAPRFETFFSADAISPERAKRGEMVFGQVCAKCHGTYEKAWSLPESSTLAWADQIKTVRVRYPERTKVIDVGTDPQRYLGMTSLEKGLNPLAISKKNGVVIRAQKGYVPPPLVGIWARWPYFHNNSAPDLCSVLTPSSRRPVTYFSGEALDPSRDFDLECNGYPLGTKTPVEWTQNSDHLYDTRRAGMSNRGHDERIFVVDGKEILSPEDKRDLIQFLQTL